MASERESFRQRVALAGELAEQILSDRELHTAPIEIEDVVESHGVRVEYVPMVSDGSISWRSKSPRIRVNSRNSDVRKRFTLAHEFGHYIWKTRFGNSDH